jgi:hypothetical protein
VSGRVHVRDAQGQMVFNRLLDEGSARLRFHSGHGWVDKRDLRLHGWTLHPGWPESSSANGAP